MKLTSKLATVAEAYDHGKEPDLTQLDEEVIPDLQIFAARLANDRGIDLETAFTEEPKNLRGVFRKASAS